MWAILSAILPFVTFCISWFVLPFMANKHHKDFLHTNGYITEDKLGEVEQKEQNVQQVDGIEQIKKLSDLKEQGIITDDEFNEKKEKLLATI